MFGSGSGTARGSGSQVSGPCLHPTQFFWPHGGRRVFLSGSFTGWREHIPMAPTEGCPRVFQVVWNLTPGHHQYKFIVDGEWRHNELQPFIKGSCGCVNTIFLEGGPDMVPTIVIPESSNRSNMDVDVDVFAPVEAVPRFSRGDLDLTRHRISAFLSRVTAYELLPESGKVVALDLSLPVKQAFEILYEEGVPMAPLWDFSRGQFVGVVSALDFILILRELGRHGSNLTEEQLETHTIAAWKEAKLQLRRPLVGTERSYPLRFVSAEPYESLKEVALKILQWKVATVPVVDSYSEDGSFPRLLHLATLSGILACICRHFKHSSGYLPILQIPISEFPLGTWVPTIGQPNGRQLAMLRPNSSLADALSLLVQAEVSSIPIVDDNDSLLDIYSRSDITALARHRAYTQIRLDQISIHQALQFGQNENSPFGLFGGQRCQMCLRSDPLHKVMLRLASPGVRRIVVVEAGSRRVQGIISLSDVFRFLLG